MLSVAASDVSGVLLALGPDTLRHADSVPEARRDIATSASLRLSYVNYRGANKPLGNSAKSWIPGIVEHEDVLLVERAGPKILERGASRIVGMMALGLHVHTGPAF